MCDRCPPTSAREAACPDTTPERLLFLATRYPAVVLENPALALLSLEDPRLALTVQWRARYALLEKPVRELRIPVVRGGRLALRHNALRIWALEVAVEVFRAFPPEDKGGHLRRALAAGRAFVRGEAPKEQLEAANRASYPTRPRGPEGKLPPAYFAARTVHKATSPRWWDLRETASYASRCYGAPVYSYSDSVGPEDGPWIEAYERWIPRLEELLELGAGGALPDAPTVPPAPPVPLPPLPLFAGGAL